MTTDARVSQDGLDVVEAPTADARVSQVGADVVEAPAATARVSQVGADVVEAPSATARVSQVGADVIWRVATVPTTARHQLFGSSFALGTFGFDYVIDNLGDFVTTDDYIVVDNAADDVVGALGDIVGADGDDVITNSYWH